MKELIKLLEGVSDTYPAFVHGVSAFCRNNPDAMHAIKKYVKENKDANSSDITEQLDDFIDA